MLRRVAAAVLVALLGLAVMAGPALAAPTSSVPGVAGNTDLPTGFPDDLRQYVAGTAEWSASPWMTGACAGQGGDVGAYINAVAKVQSRLMYWAAPAEQREAMWALAILNGSDKPTGTVIDHELPADRLPRGPGPGDAWTTLQYPRLCATQAAAWGSPAANVFGFSWSTIVDQTTVAALTPEQAAWAIFKNPCATGGDEPYCAQMYLLNCDLAAGDTKPCTDWNTLTLQNLSVMKTWAGLGGNLFGDLVGFLKSIGSDLWSAGKAIVDGFKSVWSVVEKIAKFVSDPASALDDLANAIKDGAVSLLDFVLSQMNQASSWDPGQGGFLGRYAMAAAIGIVLLAFMFLGAINDAHDRGDRKGLADLLRRFGIAFVLILFAPALYAFLEQGATAGSQSIIDRFTAPTGGDALAKLAGLGAITSAMVPGGTIVGLLLFLLMLLGTLGLYLGLMVQRFGVEIAATMIALTAALYVHPSWSKRVSKLNFLVIGLIAAKPVTFLVVGAAFGVIGDNLTAEQLTSSPANVLGGLTIAAVGIVFAGLAPMALLKWAPVLSIGHSGSGGGMVTSAAIGAGSAAVMSSIQNSRGRQSGAAAQSAAGGRDGQPGDGGQGSSGRDGGPNLVSALDSKSKGSAASGGAAGPSGAGGAAGAAGNAGSAGAGASAKGAAGAGAAAATGGASVIAQIGQAAAQKAHHAANNHVPDTDGPEDGER